MTAMTPSRFPTWCKECDRHIDKGDPVIFHSMGRCRCTQCAPYAWGQARTTVTDENEATWHRLEADWVSTCAGCGGTINQGDMFWWSSETTGACCAAQPQPQAPLPLAAATWWRNS